MWQDYIIAGTQGILTISLIPMIFQKNAKPTLWSSIPTGTGLVVIAYTVFTLGLWFSTISAAIASFLWFVLVIQRLKSSKR